MAHTHTHAHAYSETSAEPQRTDTGPSNASPTRAAPRVRGPLTPFPLWKRWTCPVWPPTLPSCRGQSAAQAFPRTTERTHTYSRIRMHPTGRHGRDSYVRFQEEEAGGAEGPGLHTHGAGPVEVSHEVHKHLVPRLGHRHHSNSRAKGGGREGKRAKHNYSNDTMQSRKNGNSHTHARGDIDRELDAAQQYDAHTCRRRSAWQFPARTVQTVRSPSPPPPWMCTWHKHIHNDIATHGTESSCRGGASPRVPYATTHMTTSPVW